MVKVEYHGDYLKDLETLIRETPDISKEIDKKVNWFCKNPEDTRLDNHPLTERMEGKHAFSISSDIRIVYECLGKNTARFLAIGAHKKVYK